MALPKKRLANPGPNVIFSSHSLYQNRNQITSFFLELLDFIYNITSSFIKHVTKNFLLLLLIYGGASCKEPARNAGDLRDIGSIPGLGRSPGDGHGNPFQCSCLENPIDRGDWRATIHTVTESDTTKVT